MAQWKTTVTAEGEAAQVALPRPLSNAWKSGTELSVVPLGPDGALLLRGGVPPGGFVATQLSAFGVDELFGYVISNIRTGKLVVVTGGARKTVSFRDGQVVFATSTDPWERLGAALVNLKLLTQEQLDGALPEVKPGSRLGQVLTRKGLITQARLYAGMTFLVREIVLDLFSLREGAALFLDGVRSPDDELKLPDATRELALEGMRRSEEVRRFRLRLRPELRVAQAGAAPEAPGLSIWQRAGDGQELSALRQGFHGSEHAFLSTVAELLDSGALVIRPRALEALPSARAAEALPVLDRYGAVVRAICAALVEGGAGLEDLRAFLAEPSAGMEKAFEGVTLSEGGELDLQRVMNNLGPGPGGRARAYQALTAFVSYALFSARNALPAGVAERLSQQVRALHEEENP